MLGQRRRRWAIMKSQLEASRVCWEGHVMYMKVIFHWTFTTDVPPGYGYIYIVVFTTKNYWYHTTYSWLFSKCPTIIIMIYSYFVYNKTCLQSPILQIINSCYHSPMLSYRTLLYTGSLGACASDLSLRTFERPKDILGSAQKQI